MINFIFILMLELSVLLNENLNPKDIEVSKIIVIDELSDENMDKKEQIKDEYDKIIVQYADAIKNDYYLDIRRTDEELFRKKIGSDFNQSLLLDLWVENYNQYDFQVFYALKDIDYNGIPELFIGSSNGIDKIKLYDIYTFNGIKAINPFDEFFSKNCDFGYRDCLYLYTNGILAELWTNSGFNHGWSFYQFKENGVNIELLDVISQDYNYEGKICYFHHMDWLSERYKHDYEGKVRISDKEHSQIYDKYTGDGEDKLFWNKICEIEDTNTEEQVQLKEKFERDIDYTMDVLTKESHEEIRQISLKTYYEKKDKIKNAYEELIDIYTDAIKNHFYQELKERDIKSYEIQLEPYLSRQVMEDSALYKKECYDYRIYCSIEDIDENGIPELLIGVSNGIDGLYFCDMVTFDGEKIIKLFDESDYVYGKKKELFLSSGGIFGFWKDEGEKGLKTEFYKLSSDGCHVEFIESIFLKVNDDNEKKYYRNKNGEYEISYELYMHILDEYKILSADEIGIITKISR